MDGLTASREIRKKSDWKTLPIIALTAKAMPNDREECLRAGADDYIAKPLDVDKLLSLIKVWIPK
jgi:CheY-like chemotaxis protein